MSAAAAAYGPPYVSEPTRLYWKACVDSAFARKYAVPDFWDVRKALGWTMDQSVEAYEELEAHGFWTPGMVSGIEAIATDSLGCVRIRQRPKRRPNPVEWQALREAVFERDDYTCTYCGSRGGILECDHVIPVAKDGSHEMSNLTTACRPCNRSKRDKLLSQWRPGP